MNKCQKKHRKKQAPAFYTGEGSFGGKCQLCYSDQERLDVCYDLYPVYLRKEPYSSALMNIHLETKIMVDGKRKDIVLSNRISNHFQIYNTILLS